MRKNRSGHLLRLEESLPLPSSAVPLGQREGVAEQAAVHGLPCGDALDGAARAALLVEPRLRRRRRGNQIP